MNQGMPRFTIESLVPEVYAHYRPAIADAFGFLLDRLPAPYSHGLPKELRERGLTLAQWVEFLRQSPTLHKLAQVLGRNRHLAAELRAALQTLESFTPRVDAAGIRKTVRAQLGQNADEISIDEQPLAEASVAVVIPFGVRCVSSGQPSRGVLKILKPGIRQRLETELGVWSDLGSYFNERCAAYSLPNVDYRETFDTIADLLRNEVDLAGEQRHLVAAREQLRVPGIIVPQLLPYCTPNVTAMERIEGTTITELADPAQAPLEISSRERLARALLEAVLAAPFWSMNPHSMFHADPHGGNLVATTGGQLALLDWALVGFLTENDREHLAQIVLRAATFDAAGICQAVEGLSEGDLQRPDQLRTAVDAVLVRFRGQFVPTLVGICALLDAAATKGGVKLPNQLLLYRKALMTVEGVVTDLAGDGFADRALRDSAATQLLREWPARCLLPPFSRALGSRLSSLDLCAAGIQYPAAAMQRLVPAAAHWAKGC